MQHVTEFTIGDLARVAGMTERNVRAYQGRGLLPPPHRRGRRAWYGVEHVARLRLVRGLAAHGLTLRVIADLVERGTADDELARLTREDLPAGWARTVTVPMHPDNLRRLEDENPGLVAQMTQIGLFDAEGDELRANTTGLGLVSAMTARGMNLTACAQIGLIAAQAADACFRDMAAAVRQVGSAANTRDADPHGDPDEGPLDGELSRLAVQLASTAFADLLNRRLLDAGVSEPRP